MEYSMTKRATPMCDCEKGTNLHKPSRVYKPTRLALDGETCFYCEHYVMWELKREFVPVELESVDHEIHLNKHNSGRYYYE
jgi:hypothetical protein